MARPTGGDHGRSASRPMACPTRARGITRSSWAVAYVNALIGFGRHDLRPPSLPGPGAPRRAIARSSKVFLGIARLDECYPPAARAVKWRFRTLCGPIPDAVPGATPALFLSQRRLAG